MANYVQSPNYKKKQIGRADEVIMINDEEICFKMFSAHESIDNLDYL